MEEKNELQYRNVLRLSNKESNRITRECIEIALIKLMNEKEIDKISITELVKKAGVSRTAFYRNYSSKEEVLSGIGKQILDSVLEMARDAFKDQGMKEFYRNLFRMMQEERENIDILVKANIGSSRMLDISIYLRERFSQRTPEEQYMILAWWGGIMNVATCWYRSGMKEDVEWMASLCSDITGKNPDVKNFLGEEHK